MTGKLTAWLLLFFCQSIYYTTSYSQNLVSPQYSVDGPVYAMATKGDTLILGGSFNHIGQYTGGAAFVGAGTDTANFKFPKIVGNVLLSTPDGNGGFYVYGTFRKESEPAGANLRIEHILADFTYDVSFSYIVGGYGALNKILFYNGLLYIASGSDDFGGITINGQSLPYLAAIDVATNLLVANLPVFTYLAAPAKTQVSGLYSNGNSLYVTGLFTDVGGQARQGIAAFDITSKTVKSWDFGARWPDRKLYSDMEFFRDSIVIAGNFEETFQGKNSLATTDTLSGSTINYLITNQGAPGPFLNYIPYGSTISNLAISNDTLFAFSVGTEFRLFAINLGDSNKLLWSRYLNFLSWIYDMKAANGNLYVAGDFTTLYNDISPTESNIAATPKGAFKLRISDARIMNWDPQTVGSGGGAVRSIHVSGNSVLLAGVFGYVHGKQRNSIVMLNTVEDKILPFSKTMSFSTIRGFKIVDSILYAAGNFSNVEGFSGDKTLLSFNLNSGVASDMGLTYFGTAYSIEADALRVYLGGYLTEPAGGGGRTNLLAVDKQTNTYTSWAPNPNNLVSALHLSNGKLYVGGAFTNISGTNRNYLVAYDTTTFTLSPWNPKPNDQVKALTSDHDLLWAGGYFTNIGDTTCNLFAGIDTGTAKVALKPVSTFAGAVFTLLKMGCFMVAAGDLYNSSVPDCHGYIMYNIFDTITYPSNNPCLNLDDRLGDVYALARNKRDLYIGGAFTEVNNKVNSTYFTSIHYYPSIMVECQEFVSVQDGNWHDTATWKYGQAPNWKTGEIPPNNARVVLNHKVTVNKNATVYSLTIEGAGQLDLQGGKVEILH